MTRKLTSAILRKAGACPPGIAIFESYFPKGADVNEDNIRLMHNAKQHLKLEWFIQHCLPKEAYSEYNTKLLALGDAFRYAAREANTKYPSDAISGHPDVAHQYLLEYNKAYSAHWRGKRTAHIDIILKYWK